MPRLVLDDLYSGDIERDGGLSMRLFGKRASQVDAGGGSVAATSSDAGGHDLRLPDVRIHYQSWGQQTTSERAVILIHGLTASSMAFAELGPALAAQGYYV